MICLLTLFSSQSTFAYTFPFTWNGFSLSFIYLKFAHDSLLAFVSVLITHELLDVPSLFFSYCSTNIYAQGGVWVR